MITINSIGDVQSYLRRIRVKSDHHANNVRDLIERLSCAVFTKYPKAMVREYMGQMGNILYIVGENTNKKYYFKYNHDEQSIDIRENSPYGTLIKRFTNNTPSLEIIETVSSM
jgi:hypothetical protein